MLARKSHKKAASQSKPAAFCFGGLPTGKLCHRQLINRPLVIPIIPQRLNPPLNFHRISHRTPGKTRRLQQSPNRRSLARLHDHFDSLQHKNALHWECRQFTQTPPTKKPLTHPSQRLFRASRPNRRGRPERLTSPRSRAPASPATPSARYAPDCAPRTAPRLPWRPSWRRRCPTRWR